MALHGGHRFSVALEETALVRGVLPGRGAGDRLRRPRPARNAEWDAWRKYMGQLRAAN
jgi:hypothetical protein